MRTTASRCTTGALKAVLEVLRMLSMVPPSMLAEIAFLDERWFQSSATHVATLRRMADCAVADPALLTIVAVESGGALPACCAGCARFVDEGAFTVMLMSLLRRERLYRSALGWAADLCVVESRAEAELSLNTTVQFADVLDGDHLYDTTKRP
jgi:hypothetical protein